MTASARISDLVMRMQGEFLDTPGLTLKLDDATTRFGVDGTVCDAVLTLLVDARVLTRNQDGAFRRFIPAQLSLSHRAA